MAARDSEHSWFGPSLLEERLEAPEEQLEFRRLWLGFMTARVTLALMLLLLQGTLYLLGQTGNPWLAVLCAAHLAAALIARIAPEPRRLGQTFDRYWLVSIGLDVLVFTLLQLLHGS
ncbi:MAG: PAS domain-containing sensor histidine kinase, partial [Curvibacter sp.]